MNGKIKKKNKLNQADIKKVKESGLLAFKCSLSATGKQMSFWCPFCLTEHAHGVVFDETEYVLTHRVPHCIEPTPLRASHGYYIFHDGIRR